jgi:hypothetical protein
MRRRMGFQFNFEAIDGLFGLLKFGSHSQNLRHGWNLFVAAFIAIGIARLALWLRPIATSLLLVLARARSVDAFPQV